MASTWWLRRRFGTMERGEIWWGDLTELVGHVRADVLRLVDAGLRRVLAL